MTPAKPQPRYLPTLTEVVQPQERVYGQSEPNKPPPVGIDAAKQGGTDLTQIEAELRAALQVVAQDQVREFSATVDRTVERLVQDALVRLGKSKSN